MKMCKRFVWIAVFLVGLASCDAGLDNEFYILNYWVDFTSSEEGWVGDFADYPATETDSVTYGLKIERTDLPANLGAGKKALLVTGNNYCDDLFMFIKKKISGLQPSTEYTIVFHVELASNAPTGSAAGGKPGEGVYLKAGAVSREPKKVIEGNFYRMNIDKGNHENQGEDMKVIGNIAVAPDTDNYQIITRTNSSAIQPIKVRSNSNGDLWIVIGTDSDFEGLTSVYYTAINVVLSISQ